MNKIYNSYFNSKTVAERYSKGRPQYHSFVIGKIKETLSIETRLDSVLDIGCGTGFSSVALKEIAEKIVGLDISGEMLRFAEKQNNIFYLAASAENIPFTESEFDLITISQAIHWIDRAKFFNDAARVLKPDSFIIAYDNYFLGKMTDNPDFNVWYKTDFLKIFPTPPRGESKFPTKSKRDKDFVLVKEKWHENEIEFSVQGLVDFLITITNVINSVENGRKTIEEVKDFLEENIEPFFRDEKRKKFIFNAPIWYFHQGVLKK